MRRLQQIAKKEVDKTVTDEEEEEAERLVAKSMDVMISCFDDGEDGKKSKLLVSSLSNDELKIVYDQIFEEKPDETKDTSTKTKA